ncbi:MAG TPA: hypothetical protein VGM84_21730 [Steroidobacteraceae bacterium]|jgi:hypothetical protein
MLSRSISVLASAAAIVGGAAATVTPTVAVAHTYERCDFDGDHCVRIKCDNDGDRCWKQSKYAESKSYRREGRWICDKDGDRCHYEYKGHPWNPRHWDDDDHR